MVTIEQLQTIMPRLPAKKAAELFPFLQAAMTEFAVDAPARAAAFLAQLAHESGQFRFMEEIWGPTEAQESYEPQSELATRLGNTEPGDGKRFKGRGPIQLTGRANYRRFGDLLGLDLVSEPARAAAPDVAFRISGLYWSKKGLNELADLATTDAFREITRRINGGFNGLADRLSFYRVARTTLGVPGPLRSQPRGRALPGPDNEPIFERGFEAIRALARRRKARKARRPNRRSRSTTGRKTVRSSPTRGRRPSSTRER